MSARPLRVGVLGAGFGAAVHAPAFISEGWEVPCIFTRNRDKGEAAAASLDLADVHTEPEALIARDDLDAVAIATPPSTHHPYALAAIHSGKHVLCEKPFALNAKEAVEMQKAAETAGVTAMVAHEFRYSPQRRFVREMVQEGKLGALQIAAIHMYFDDGISSVPSDRTWNDSAQAGGGLLGALGSHFVDALRDWFGDVAAAYGRLEQVSPDVIDPTTGGVVTSETEDAFTFDLEFRSGGSATMVALPKKLPGPTTTIALVGRDGAAFVEQKGPNPPEKGVVWFGELPSEMSPLDVPKDYAPFSDSRDDRLMAFRLLVREFTEGINAGRSPSPNFLDGLRCQEVLDAIRLSSQRKERVEITSNS